MVQIPTEVNLMEKDSVEFSASLNSRRGMRSAYMRIPSTPIQTQMKVQGTYCMYVYYRDIITSTLKN